MTAKRPGVSASPEQPIAADEPIWHVSINEVPIGPIKREELAHKIDSGAVSEYSLVWNSSFEEWRPLATVPELMSLIHNRRGSQPPVASRFSSAPPEARTRVAQVNEALRASSVPQQTVTAAPGLSDPFGQAIQPQAPVKSPLDGKFLDNPFDDPTVHTTLGDALDQPTVSSMLDEQPTVNAMLDEPLDQLTVSTMLDDLPTVNAMLDGPELATSLVPDPLAPMMGGRPGVANAPPAGIPVPRHEGSGSFSTVLTASSFSPEAPDGSVAARPPMPASAAPNGVSAQERRSVGAPHPIGQFPRASSLAVPAEGAYPSVPRAPQPVTTRESGMSPWAWAMVVSFAVFAGVFAVLAFNKLINEGQLGPFSFNSGDDEASVADLPTESEITETAITETGVSEAEAAQAAIALEAVPEEPAPLFQSDEADEGLAANSVQLSDEGTDMEFELDEPAEGEPADEKKEVKAASKAKPRARSKAKSSRAALTKLESKPSGIRRLSSDGGEDAELIAKFAQSEAGGAAKIDVASAPSSQAQRKPLDSKALTSVVSKNKPRLQRCYERAIRGQQAPPSVRLDVAVKVAASGRVTSAKAAGRGPGGLTECVESLVRRWRFPVSSESVETRFPVVFSAN